MSVTTNKSFSPSNKGKDIRYLNKNFDSFKTDLISYAKSYFPNTYTDFSPASPGMMFIEMASYVGDILSYYTDYSLKEGLFQDSSERKNIISLAKSRGYKPKTNTAATCTLDVYQICPSLLDSTGNYIPDPLYLLSINENMIVSNGIGSFYRTLSPVNFSVDTGLSPRDTTVYSRTSAGIPDFFLLKKSVKASAGTIITKQFTITDPESFYQIQLTEDNVIQILSIVDSDNNQWYEVDCLAQELILTDVPNNDYYESAYVVYNNEVPYILKYIRTSRRFTTEIDDNNITTITFGSGTEGFSDELININSQVVGIGLSNINKLNIPYDPSNFLKNETYGISPANTTLTVTYVIGGGVTSNCPSNDIRNVNNIIFDNTSDGLTTEQVSMLNNVKSSVRVNNSIPATGGKDFETNEEIKQNASAFFACQNRAVTREDYLVRIFSMPPKYGSIAKAQITTNSSLNIKPIDFASTSSFESQPVQDKNNPFSINIYVLTYDKDKKLTKTTPPLVNNLVTYLKQYRVLTDGINIIDGYIINIGVDFSVSIYKTFNKKEVLQNCITTVKDFFNIDNWNFTQVINLSQLELEIAKVEGVQSVINVKIYNKTVLDGEEYSTVQYDIDAATRNKIIYPSLDPSCWELKFPERDIRASIVS